MKHKLPPIAFAVVASMVAVPGAEPPATALETDTLTLFDTLPQPKDLSTMTIDRLRELALGSKIDTGIQLRAIRALPNYCVPDCHKVGVTLHPAHAAALEILASVPVTERTGKAILKRRAALEAIGLIRSGDLNDLAVVAPFLDHESRDLRTTAALALRDLCLPAANNMLRTRYQSETVAQVRLAISAALLALSSCSQ